MLQNVRNQHIYYIIIFFSFIEDPITMPKLLNGSLSANWPFTVPNMYNPWNYQVSAFE